MAGPVCQNCGAALTSRQRRCPECGTAVAAPRAWGPSVLVTAIVVILAGAMLAVGYAQLSDDAADQAAAPSPTSRGKKVVPQPSSASKPRSQKRDQRDDKQGQEEANRSR